MFCNCNILIFFSVSNKITSQKAVWGIGESFIQYDIIFVLCAVLGDSNNCGSSGNQRASLNHLFRSTARKAQATVTEVKIRLVQIHNA